MPTILLADDAGLFVALETIPVVRSACRLVTVRSTRELVARAATDAPDLFLLDADALGPGLRASIKRLKADRKLRGVPIVLATHDTEGIHELLSEKDVLFEKPVQPERVGAALKRLLPLPRRGSARIHIAVPVTCRIGGRRVKLQTKDVGAGGLFLKTPRDLRCGTRFEASFWLPDPAAPGDVRTISATCEVVRRVDPDDEDLIAGVGAAFVRLDRGDLQFLKKFVTARGA